MSRESMGSDEGSSSASRGRLSGQAGAAVPSGVTSFFDESFQPLRALGHGVSGAALLARHRVTGVFYAVKVVLVRDYESEKDILQEVRLHAVLDSRHLVRYHACWSEVVTPKRAQQLVQIGLCHRREARLPRRLLINGPTTTRASFNRSLGGSASGTMSGQQSSIVGWDYLRPSELDGGGNVLVGEDSFPDSSGSARKMRMHARPQRSRVANVVSPSYDTPRGFAPSHVLPHSASTALVQEYDDDDDDDDKEDEDDGEKTEAEEGEMPSHQQALLSASGTPLDSRGLLSAHSLTSDSDEEDEEDEEAASTSSSNASFSEGSVIGSRVVFLQMELCQMTLGQHLAVRKSVDRVENLVIGLQLFTGLRYLHRRGILHRDIKPTNIFVDFRCQVSPIEASSSSSVASHSEDGELADYEIVYATGGALPTASTCVREDGELRCTSATAAAREGASPTALVRGSVTTHQGKVWGERFPTPTAVTTNDDYADQMVDLLLNTPHRSAAELLRQRMRAIAARRAAARRGKVKQWSAEMLARHTSALPVHHDATTPPPHASATAGSQGEPRRTAKWLQRTLVQVRLGDFGLAKFLAQQRVNVSSYFARNDINTVGVGSPLYSSPEQLNGNICTTASDVFSLGVVLAEMYVMPKTTAERLVILREVREGVFPTDDMVREYPELSVVRSFTRPNAASRMRLDKARKVFRNVLFSCIQEHLAKDGNEEDEEKREGEQEVEVG